MIQIDMAMPIQCDCCRFCLTEYTDDNKPDSYAYCCAAEKFIAHASDGTDRVVSTAILKKQSWCPLKAQQPHLLTLDEIHDSMVVYLEAGEKFLKLVDDDGVVLAIGGSERAGAKCFITVWDVNVAAMNDEYNLTWRAWSGRPTKEQREGKPWLT